VAFDLGCRNFTRDTPNLRRCFENLLINGEDFGRHRTSRPISDSVDDHIASGKFTVSSSIT